MNSNSYNFFSFSPSDPHLINNPDYKGLGFHTEQQAQNHVDKMQQMIDQYDTNPVWNKQYWKQKPQSWVIKTGSNN